MGSKSNSDMVVQYVGNNLLKVVQIIEFEMDYDYFKYTRANSFEDTRRVLVEDITSLKLYHSGKEYDLFEFYDLGNVKKKEEEDDDGIYPVILHDSNHVNHMPDIKDRPDWMKSTGLEPSDD